MNDGHINASMDINNASLDVTFGEVYEIDKGMPAAIIANLYSSQSTYSPGDYVIYRNKLYKCLVAIETPEEFDTEKWELVKVAEELKEKADKSTTYTKTETDALLDEKANANNVYTKTETDALLDEKANSDNVYTKAESDTLLDEKADRQSTLAALSSLSDAINTKADAAGTTAALALKADKTYVDTELDKKADKSSTYTKTEVDTALASKAAADSVYTKVETNEAISVATDAINANFALEFNPEWTYESGEFCIYEGRFKRCVNGYSEPKPFDENDWTNVEVGQLIWGTEAMINDGLNGKMDKSNPTGTGALSINRKANTTVGEESTAFGYNPTASGKQSIAGGYNSTASNTISVALGNAANASGFAATAFGTSTRATGNYSQAEGYQTRAGGGSSHAEGNQSYASGGVSHAEGYSTQAQGQYSHAEGNTSIASGSTSHAEGYSTTASGDYSHAEGRETIASAYSSHAEGLHTQATQNYSHSEGCSTIASGHTSHAEGYETTASGDTSHAEGYKTTASGTYSHAEGNNTTANSYSTHAEGDSTIASGDSSHAEGLSTTASGDYSHSEGFKTIANHKSQHVFGEYNVEDNSENEQSERGNYVEIVGNGYWDSEEEESVCSNARTLDWNGNEVLAGDLTYNGNKSLESEISRLDGRIDDLPKPVIFKGTLGVGGTVTELPVASESVEGWEFKCITEGTYAGMELKVGDTVTCFNPPNTSVYEWEKTGSQDTDTDTWRNIKVNGIEKLGNGISSGAVDFEDTANVKFEFDADGNKVKATLSGIYTSSEVNDLLDDKADADNTYTKAQVDAIVSDAIYNVLPDDTASGSVANFTTSLALPIKSLEIDVNAVQSSGTPTPATPLPISGWDEISVTRCGKNLFDGVSVVYGYPFNGTIKGGNLMRVVFSRCKPNTTYTISKIQTQRFSVFWCEELPAVGVPYSGSTADNLATSITVTTGATAKYICAFVYNQNVDTLTPEEILSSVQIEEGDATTYEPYNGSTTVIQLNNTYYGGHFTQDKDGKRELVVTKEITTLGELTNWRYAQGSGVWRFQAKMPNDYKLPEKISERLDFISSCFTPDLSPTTGGSVNNSIAGYTNDSKIYILCNSYTDLETFLTDLSSQTLVYPLAEPFTVALPDGQPIKSFHGINNFFADTGDSTVVFKDSVNGYVEKKIASVQALTLNT